MKARIIVSLCLMALSPLAKAEMVRSDSIGNDSERVKICAARAKGKPVPFEIDSEYVKRARALHPEVTFVAIDGISPQLVECQLREGTGKFEPNSFSPEQGYWRLPRPKQFEPSVNSPAGRNFASKICADEAQNRSSGGNFDHSVVNAVVEISNTGPKYRSGALIAGKKAERYDVAVEGTSFYKSSGVDLKAVKFSCLLSPMLELKAFQSK